MDKGDSSTGYRDDVSCRHHHREHEEETELDPCFFVLYDKDWNKEQAYKPYRKDDTEKTDGSHIHRYLSGSYDLLPYPLQGQKPALAKDI